MRGSFVPIAGPRSLTAEAGPRGGWWEEGADDDAPGRRGGWVDRPVRARPGAAADVVRPGRRRAQGRLAPGGRAVPGGRGGAPRGTGRDAGGDDEPERDPAGGPRAERRVPLHRRRPPPLRGGRPPP